MAASDRIDDGALERWLKSCADGDKQAFSDLYLATSAKFHAVVLKMVRCDETTRDILQKGYLSIWTNAARFDPGKAKAFTWMLVIMRNKAIDVLRSSRTASRTEEITEHLLDEAPRPPVRAQMNQAARVLEAKLAKLPDRVSQAVVLHVVHGYSCKEIGERFDASPNTVKSWIRRGLERLRAEMPYDSFAAAL